MVDPINQFRPPQQTPQINEMSDAYFVLTYGVDYLGRRFIKIRKHDTHLSGYEVDRKDEEGLPLEQKEIIEIASRYGFDISGKSLSQRVAEFNAESKAQGVYLEPNPQEKEQEIQAIFFKKPPQNNEKD